MVRNLRTVTLCLTGMLVSLWHPVFAGTEQPAIRVGISPFSPFVIFTEGAPPSGISIDAWKTISTSLGPTTFVRCTGVADKLKKLQDGQIDVAIGGITITKERESRFDFSHPLYHTGLDILVPRQDRFTFLALIASLFTGQKLVFFAWLLFLVIVAGHIIWLVERSSPKKRTRFQRNYFPGVFEGMYWALVTASTVGYGDKVPKRWAGRILTGILIVLFLPLSAFFIAQVSSDLTLKSIQSSISGLEDLWGKRVGVVRGTTSYDFMKHERAHLFAFRTAASAYDALDRDALDAVVYDAPALLYYANGAGRGKVKVVGKLFAPQDYGIALPQGSHLRESINRQILATLESGQIEEILTNWFGPNHRR
jgi:polar amino acid transport system substrate-binding protein